MTMPVYSSQLLPSDELSAFIYKEIILRWELDGKERKEDGAWRPSKGSASADLTTETGIKFSFFENDTKADTAISAHDERTGDSFIFLSTNKRSQIAAIARRLRNSFAHGRIAFDGKYWNLTDEFNGKQTMKARLQEGPLRKLIVAIYQAEQVRA